jgi:putative oxidoreductase
MINSSTAPYAALILRLSLGILFLAHVALKIFVFTIPGFETACFPAPEAPPVWVRFPSPAPLFVGSDWPTLS